MPYQYYPPTLLELPLEIRHCIYSYLLVTPSVDDLIDTKLFRDDKFHSTVRNVFSICRQIHDEAFVYYYSKNTFQVSLVSSYYRIEEVAAELDVLERRLKHVDKLHVIIETSKEQLDCTLTTGNHLFPSNKRYPKQQLQWDSLFWLLKESKAAQKERILKELVVTDCARPRCLNQSASSLEDAEIEIAVYSRLLAPIRKHIDRIRISRPCYSRSSVLGPSRRCGGCELHASR